MNRQRRFVINVDDLGLHPAVNRFVRKAANDGVISSASVMANGPCFEDVVGMRERGELDPIGLGAHLNILRGRPLSRLKDVRSLVNAEGLFPGSFARLYANVMSGRAVLAEVEAEWSRQIEHLRENGFTLTHLDAEQHTHCIPRLTPIIYALAERYGIRWVRRPYERKTTSWRAWLLRRWINEAAAPMSAVRAADAVWGISDQGRRLTAEALAAYIARQDPDETVEILCHPGAPEASDPPIPAAMGRMKVQKYWAIEAAAISSPLWKQAISAREVRLCHFGSIEPAGV